MPTAAPVTRMIRSIRTGVATPVVSASVTASTPAATTSAQILATSFGPTTSWAEPNAHEMTTPICAACAKARISVTCAMDDATLIPTLFWLHVSEADTVTVMWSMPAANASSAPRRLGTRTHDVNLTPRTPTTSWGRQPSEAPPLVNKQNRFDLAEAGVGEAERRVTADGNRPRAFTLQPVTRTTIPNLNVQHPTTLSRS